jgi:hypothetical protein
MINLKISTYANGTKSIYLVNAGHPSICLTEEEGEFYHVVGDDKVPEGASIIDPTLTRDHHAGDDIAISLLNPKGILLHVDGKAYPLCNVIKWDNCSSVFVKSVDNGKNVAICAEVLLKPGEYAIGEDGSVTPIDSRVHQFGFDFIVTENISIKEIESRIINQLCMAGIEGIEVVGNPGLTGASWSKPEYGL